MTSHTKEALHNYAEPLLAQSYVSATQDVCKHYTKVSTTKYRNFIFRQKQLDELYITYDRYAYSVVKSWWSWCKSKNMNCVPVNIFCGKKAWERFLSQNDTTIKLSTPIDDAYANMLHDELCIASLYIGYNIHGQSISWRDAVALYGSSDRSRKSRDDAVQLLSELYGCDAQSYDDIVEALHAAAIH